MIRASAELVDGSTECDVSLGFRGLVIPNGACVCRTELAKLVVTPTTNLPLSRERTGVKFACDDLNGREPYRDGCELLQ